MPAPSDWSHPGGRLNRRVKILRSVRDEGTSDRMQHLELSA
ncbi:hypothetical protein [Agriterribacter sp.]|nr:hypothetical protein [Agriterribacter sp.]HRP57279.1 hypothetical protein [Agriterribacter sp.]